MYPINSNMTIFFSNYLFTCLPEFLVNYLILCKKYLPHSLLQSYIDDNEVSLVSLGVFRLSLFEILRESYFTLLFVEL